MRDDDRQRGDGSRNTVAKQIGMNVEQQHACAQQRF